MQGILKDDEKLTVRLPEHVLVFHDGHVVTKPAAANDQRHQCVYPDDLKYSL